MSDKVYVVVLRDPDYPNHYEIFGGDVEVITIDPGAGGEEEYDLLAADLREEVKDAPKNVKDYVEGVIKDYNMDRKR